MRIQRTGTCRRAVSSVWPVCRPRPALCLDPTTGRWGSNAVRSRVGAFGEPRFIVVERSDRLGGPDGKVIRVHQEDLCQALGIPPTRKYQNEGGPTPEHIIHFLRQ
ncbi:MAG: HipA domain-containing protein, partial [Micromonosporaceae bacterium]|nr:HipA domain-containing protein [Micromonosporaceae bacterium]